MDHRRYVFIMYKNMCETGLQKTHFQTATTSSWGLKWGVTNNNHEKSDSEQKRQIQNDLEYCQKHFQSSKFDPRRNGISASLILVPKVSFKHVIYDLSSFTPTWLCKTSAWTYDDLDKNFMQETVQTNKNFLVFFIEEEETKNGKKEHTRQKLELWSLLLVLTASFQSVIHGLSSEAITATITQMNRMADCLSFLW